jgi:hypothetical protein
MIYRVFSVILFKPFLRNKIDPMPLKMENEIYVEIVLLRMIHIKKDV